MGKIIDTAYALDAVQKLIPYIPVTLGLAVSSMILASLLGILVMLVRWKKIPVLAQLATAYVIVGRALPTLIVLYIVFFGVPVFLLMSSGDRANQWIGGISPATYAVLGLTLHTGAYLAEIFRTALQSVDKGQLEAAYAVGMTWAQAFRRILLPQAAVLAMPLMGNQFLGLIKGTSIAFMITVMEMFGAASVLATGHNHYLEVYLVLAMLYWLVSSLFEKMFRMLEIRLSYFKRSSGGIGS